MQITHSDEISEEKGWVAHGDLRDKGFRQITKLFKLCLSLYDHKQY